mmetsp:Transcript_28805/g.35042  ORF Transcript_28805/g.35042 Transcript_28805/m.35042 type:complete len:431 (-) Transcript_28805:17-1309(-)
MRIPFPLFLIPSILTTAFDDGTPSCQNDEDCSLNGLCSPTAKTCHCDAAWTGPHCELLNLLPTPVDNGLSIVTNDDGNGTHVTTWGGSVLLTEDGFVMYVAKMVNGCGLDSWQTNSEVIVATSSDAVGPYVDTGITVVSPWAHNPQAIFIPDSDDEGVGVYCVFTLGDGVPIHGPPLNCMDEDEQVMNGKHHHHTGIKSDGNTAETTRHLRTGSSDNNEPKTTNTTVSFTIHYSTTGPLGPWNSHTAIITDFNSTYSFPGNWNPSPTLLPDRRGVRIMVHTLTSPWGGEIIVEAKDWKGPYVPVSKGDVTYCTYCEEDPFTWIDARGHWHVLYHKMFDPSGEGAIPSPGWVGGHSFSRDGLVWSEIVRAYNTTVRYEDGRSVEMKRRERPKLIFDLDGVTPTHLTNGVISPDGDLVYTLVVPLNTDSASN